ncbi:leucine-rich repeat protein, partial [Intestinibacter sp.]|uniref:leucine-rich repeat protein n=1 Tax=Intestinibacter sp. TaxID=1965304 RepID=UPI003F17EECC
MIKQFKKSACFLTVLSLLLSFGFSSGSSYAMEKQTKGHATSKALSSSQVMDSYEDDYSLNIDWGFDEEEYWDSEEDDPEENGFYYIVNDRNEAVITCYYDVDYDENDEEIIRDKDVVIPNTLGGYPVTMIYDSAFSVLEITESITIPEGVKVIGEEAFSGCDKLKTVSIPSTVTAIDAFAFSWNEDLEKIVIPDNVVEIGIGALAMNQSLKDVTLPSNMKSIPAGLFVYCEALDKIDIPSGVTEIEEAAFGGTGFTEFTVPDTVTTIGDNAFALCENLVKVTIPKSVTKIGQGIFEECAKEVTIYGEKGSYAQTYANNNKIPFKTINGEPIEDPSEVIATGVTTAGLNVRKGASTSYAKIGYLAKGTKIEIVQKLSNGWYKIKYNGSYGYVSGKYVKLDGQASEVIATGVTTAGLNVRKGASTSYAKIGYLAKG